MEKKRVLIGSPVHQKPHILKEFLGSLDRLNQETVELNYIFIDDNILEESSQLLQDFKDTHNSVMILDGKKQDEYVCADDTHHWNENLVWKVAGFKNRIIETAIRLDYDYLFLVDSDILLYSQTIDHLVSTEKDIISEIHWSIWYPNWPELPNIWLFDQYNIVPKDRGENISKKEEDLRHQKFLMKLRKPGVYKVGGLCACTLINRKALQSGVSFKEIYNLTFWGEDRHFCIRAAALGLELYVDTAYPGYHIYRESDMEGVEEYKKKTIQSDTDDDHDNNDSDSPPSEDE